MRKEIKQKPEIRKDLLEAGAYDGRYRPRIVKDKKKQSSKFWARKNK